MTAAATFGRYRLLAELGHGGMANVFLAVVAGPRGTGFSKLTVLKRLRANLAEDPDFIAMLMDEARIAARLNHPNVVQTNEVGQVDEQYFIAMEYLDGQPMHRVLHRAAKDDGKVFTRAMQIVVLMDALAGLHHAHELSDYDGTPLEIVHRDVTPQNIFLTYEGQAKVVDFGIAKAARRVSETRQGIVKGKIRYMAPEQALGKNVTRTADVYAVGLMLWEAVVGRRFWEDKEDLEIIQLLLDRTLEVSPRAANPSVEEELDRICRKALAHAAADRYATAEEMRLELEQFLMKEGTLFEARKGLGPALAEMFADKRSELKAIVDRQLREIGNAPSEDYQPGYFNVDASTGAGTAPPVPPTTLVSLTLPNVPSSPGAEASGMPVPGPRDRSKRLVASGALAAALFGGAGLWAVAGAARRADVPAAEARPSQASIPIPELVSVELVAQPSTAVIRLDDRELGSAFRGQLPKDDRLHRVEVSAEGFVTRVETLAFSAQTRREFVLEKHVERHVDKKPEAPRAAPRAHDTRGGNAPAASPQPPATPTVTAVSSPPPPPPENTGRRGKQRPIDSTTDPWQ